MLKSGDPMNPDKAVELLRAALLEVPGVDRMEIVTSSAVADTPIDFVCRVTVHGREHVLAGEVKSNGQPRHVQAALFQLKRYVEQQLGVVIPLFIAPYLSEDARALCVESNVGYLDLQGNARIAFPGFFLSRTMAERPASERRELRSLFKAKSAAVLRCLLREPSKRWRVADLARETLVSVGHVSNVRASLLDRGWAEVSEEGVFLARPDGLLDAWRAEYAPPSGERRSFYTTLHGGAFDDTLRARAHELEGSAILSTFSAAKWLAPYGRTSVDSFYADRNGADLLCRTLGLVTAGRGANVDITVIDDPGFFRDAIEPVAGIRCTSVVQTYLDLFASGERGREAADHLRQEKLQWKN